MENIPGFDEVLKDLERSDNVSKIKKLLLCANTNRWENDQNTLDSLDLADLVQDTYKVATTFGHLESLILQVIKKLNKKVQYFLLASTLVQKLSKLYPDNQAKRKRIRTQLKQLKKGVKYPYDLSDLKFTVSRESTVRRAKVLVFSALNYKFGYSTQDWATLDSLEFDELVRALFYACETPEDLEFRLYGTATCLEEPDKQIKTANIIVESMLPYYQEIQRGRDITLDADEDEITEISFKANYHRPSDIQLAAQTKKEDEDEDDSYNSGEDLKIPDFILTDESDAKIGEVIKKQREVENALRPFVDSRVNAMMAVLETHIRELETELEQHLDDSQKAANAPLKYQSLRQFVRDVQAKSSQYLEMLENMEANARRG